jgi:hypothetical protein
MKLTTHFQLVPRSKELGSIHPLPVRSINKEGGGSERHYHAHGGSLFKERPF